MLSGTSAIAIRFPQTGPSLSGLRAQFRYANAMMNHIFSNSSMGQLILQQISGTTSSAEVAAFLRLEEV